MAKVSLELTEVGSFKVVSDILAGFSDDMTLSVSLPKPNAAGALRMRASAQDGAVLCFFELYEKAFSRFSRSDGFEAGVKARELGKYMKGVGVGDALEIMVDPARDGVVSFVATGPRKNKVVSCELRTLVSDSGPRKRLNLSSDVNVVMGCKEFHDGVRLLAESSENVEICCTPSEFKMACIGALSRHCRAYLASDDSESQVAITYLGGYEENKIVRLIVSLKNLKLMAKATSLCDKVIISLKNDTPMCLTYSVGDHGSATLVVAQSVERLGSEEFLIE